jgi:hypothetical protein
MMTTKIVLSPLKLYAENWPQGSVLRVLRIGMAHCAPQAS